MNFLHKFFQSNIDFRQAKIIDRTTLSITNPKIHHFRDLPYRKSPAHISILLKNTSRMFLNRSYLCILISPEGFEGQLNGTIKSCPTYKFEHDKTISIVNVDRSKSHNRRFICGEKCKNVQRSKTFTIQLKIVSMIIIIFCDLLNFIYTNKIIKK